MDGEITGVMPIVGYPPAAGLKNLPGRLRYVNWINTTNKGAKLLNFTLNISAKRFMSTLVQTTGKNWFSHSGGAVKSLINGRLKYTFRTKNHSGYDSTIDVYRKVNGEWKKLLKYRFLK